MEFEVKKLRKKFILMILNVVNNVRIWIIWKEENCEENG